MEVLTPPAPLAETHTVDHDELVTRLQGLFGEAEETIAGIRHQAFACIEAKLDDNMVWQDAQTLAEVEVYLGCIVQVLDHWIVDMRRTLRVEPFVRSDAEPRDVTDMVWLAGPRYVLAKLIKVREMMQEVTLVTDALSDAAGDERTRDDHRRHSALAVQIIIAAEECAARLPRSWRGQSSGDSAPGAEPSLARDRA